MQRYNFAKKRKKLKGEGYEGHWSNMSVLPLIFYPYDLY